MGIMTTLQDDLTKAIKTGEKPIRDVLRMMIDVIQKKEKAILTTLGDEEIVTVISTFKKQVDEELQYAYKGVDKDKINKLVSDIDIIVRYLPEQLTVSEIKALVQDIISKTEQSQRNIGNIMKQVNPLVKGKADGKVVNDIVKQSL